MANDHVTPNEDICSVKSLYPRSKRRRKFCILIDHLFFFIYSFISEVRHIFIKKKSAIVRNPCGKAVIEQKPGRRVREARERGRPGQQLLRPAPREEWVLCAEQRRQRRPLPVPAKAGG